MYYAELLNYHVTVTDAIYEALRGVYSAFALADDESTIDAIERATALSGYYATAAAGMLERDKTITELWEAYTEQQADQREAFAVISAEQLAELRSAPGLLVEA